MLTIRPQVLRYSALAFGVFYGFTHQRSITANVNAAAAKREFEHKKHLIEQAKAEFSKKKNPTQANSGREYSSPAPLALATFGLDGAWRPGNLVKRSC